MSFVVVGTVVAGIGTAYAISSGEEAKNNARKAGQAADRDQYKMDRERKTNSAREDAAKTRDNAKNRQKKIASQKQSGGNSLLTGKDGAEAGQDSATTLGGGKGKSLLGV